MADDLGEWAIKERPVIIREAIVGGRRLTKALFFQIPEIDYLPADPDDATIVAQVNIHWRDCGLGYQNFWSVTPDHRHVLVQEKGVLKRGDVFKGWGDATRILICPSDVPGGQELVALLARRRLAGQAMKVRHVGYGNAEIDCEHMGRKLRLETTFGRNPELTSYLSAAQIASGEHPRGLVAATLPAVPEADLIVALEKAIQSEIEWRETLKQLWQLVTEETPQVYL
jgi:hypothetical protein|tara:strand:- start:7844 stop:8524 length:681 start_codon:yes stop_codon:yes gene_type:complete